MDRTSDADPDTWDFRREICVVRIRFRLHCMSDNTPVADFGNWTTVARLNSERIGRIIATLLVCCRVEYTVHRAISFDS